MTLLFCIVADDDIFPQTVEALENGIEWKAHPSLVLDGRPVVLVVGPLRNGKSHLLNVMIGDEENEESSESSSDDSSSAEIEENTFPEDCGTNSVTHWVQCASTDEKRTPGLKLTLCDMPGLDDKVYEGQYAKLWDLTTGLIEQKVGAISRILVVQKKESFHGSEHSVARTLIDLNLAMLLMRGDAAPDASRSLPPVIDLVVTHVDAPNPKQSLRRQEEQKAELKEYRDGTKSSEFKKKLNDEVKETVKRNRDVIAELVGKENVDLIKTQSVPRITFVGLRNYEGLDTIVSEVQMLASKQPSSERYFVKTLGAHRQLSQSLEDIAKNEVVDAKSSVAVLKQEREDAATKFDEQWQYWVCDGTLSLKSAAVMLASKKVADRVAIPVMRSTCRAAYNKVAECLASEAASKNAVGTTIEVAATETAVQEATKWSAGASMKYLAGGACSLAATTVIACGVNYAIDQALLQRKKDKATEILKESNQSLPMLKKWYLSGYSEKLETAKENLEKAENRRELLGRMLRFCQVLFEMYSA